MMMKRKPIDAMTLDEVEAALEAYKGRVLTDRDEMTDEIMLLIRKMVFISEVMDPIAEAKKNGLFEHDASDILDELADLYLPILKVVTGYFLGKNLKAPSYSQSLPGGFFTRTSKNIWKLDEIEKNKDWFSSWCKYAPFEPEYLN